ncbi:uncharacterized protein NDAI_0D01360 [Naumovozyma dairenensis CBS 421]|uniref:Uncharacterized protein n=1 Tax=Naumovozyma dairenensis (strain ATCC 10597 / BCRC 20456 / CBS 421 / NBRC 0211 / NRRL Y-12639) TaxID=1071378 RepID=G0W9I9_NAUDC|nr:hypothetical protein NDAI_0D01360 [Naumovozyma dairenensis CBS 421]CCD24450.1 hypothetical protein NDAI_0D01360 [Naumovozyma dairenensis CBS 421]
MEINKCSSFNGTIDDDYETIEKGRYWLYVSLGCPFAHRALIARSLLGLNDLIGISVVHWHLEPSKSWELFVPPNNDTVSDEDTRRSLTDSEINIESKNEQGQEQAKWKIDDRFFQVDGGIITTRCNESASSFADIKVDDKREWFDFTYDPIENVHYLRELYDKSEKYYDCKYTGRITVPVLWDSQRKTIINNESSEIIRIFNSINQKRPENNRIGYDLYPNKLHDEIDDLNSWIYENVNTGVYKAGFTDDPQVYERIVLNLFKYLDKIEAILSKNYSKLEERYSRDKDSNDEIMKRYYMVGEEITEVDIRLYPTIIRFDTVYYQHFKCNLKMIRSNEYKYLNLWLKNLYWNSEFEAFRMTTNFDHLKLGYTRSQPKINPLGITPLGPKPDIEPL